MSKKKQKKGFKNNKIRLNSAQIYNQLVNEKESLEKLTQGVKIGDCKHIFVQVYRAMRALVCLETRNMHPLLQRVMQNYNMKLDFYANNPKLTGNIVDLAITSKCWSSKPDMTYSTKTNLIEYLEEKIYYVSSEDRYISRNDLIRLIADSEAAHFDTEIHVFSNSLDKAITSFGDLQFSQKELFMWDIYTLINWHIDMIIIEKRYSVTLKIRGKNNTIIQDLLSQKKIFTERIGDKYDKYFKNPILSMGVGGYRLCNNCKSKNLEKINDYKFECKSCGCIIEL